MPSDPRGPELLWQISGPNFEAGLTVVAGRVVQAAPIIGWVRGKRWSEVERYAKNHGWTVSLIRTSTLGSGPKPSGGTTPPA